MKSVARVAGAFLATWLASGLVPPAANAGDDSEQTAIRSVMSATWDKPESRLEVDPIVVIGDRSVAGWTQGKRGGRALLARDSKGKWQIVACAGDGLRESKTLELAGVPASMSRRLADAVAASELTVPGARRAKFSTFDGFVRMDGETPK